MRWPLIAVASLLLTSTVAIFADEAWTLDYHYALLGQPQQGTTFFHQPNPESPAALVYTLSEKGVIGAVNPRDGSLVWRQRLSVDASSSNSSFLRAGYGQDVVVSGFGSQVAAWSAADGRQVWSRQTSGLVKDVEILEIPDGKETSGQKDVITLSGGDEVIISRADGATGNVKWQYKIDNGDVPYQVSASATRVFAILLHKTMLGYIKIRVISFDPVDGSKTDEYTLSSENELATPDTIISVGANSASPIIAWTDATFTVLKINIIGTKPVLSFNIDKHDNLAVEKVQIHAPYLSNSLAHFLVHYETASSHWADVFHIDLKNNKIAKAYSLPKIAGRGAFATSTSDANVYFTRITDDQIITVSSASHGVLGKWPIKTFGVAAGRGENVYPLHAVSEVSIRKDTVSAIRSAVLLSTGDWILLRESTPLWQRPEALASIVSATFATPSAAEDFAHILEIEAHSSIIHAYVHRVIRHIGELQRLPTLLASLPQRFMRGFLGTSADVGMEGDTFGFHKIIACATDNGRVIALDAGSPDRILWSRHAFTVQANQVWVPRLRSLPGGIIGLFEMLEVPSLVLNATTGEPVHGIQPVSESGLESSDSKSVTYTIKDGGLEAFAPGKSGSDLGSLWRFIPSNGERILSLVPRPVNDPVASIGKVLGDRRVLYKYLDPNLALLVTAIDATKTATFYLLNTVSGAILHSSAHIGIDLQSPISSIISENWFAYTYTAESSDGSPKGHFLTVGELFESLTPNDRGLSSTSANFSSLHAGPEPFTLTKTYQIPEGVSKLAVTQTKQGITSRQLLAVLTDSNSITGIPYYALDPRRPVNRDPTKDEQSEGLARYSPVIEFDPRWSLNYQRELLGVTEVLTSPALLESTSLVFAYGLDIFGTRLSPSFSFDILGKGFNKFQMLATVAGLAVATVAVAPLVMRKQVNTRWSFM